MKVLRLLGCFLFGVETFGHVVDLNLGLWDVKSISRSQDEQEGRDHGSRPQINALHPR